MNSAVNPEIAALREKVEEQSKEFIAQAREISEMRGNIQQLDKIVSATTRQPIWQLIVLVISLCGAIVGGLAYQTTMIEKRIELSEKNINTRFEDLKQDVRDLRQEVHNLREEVGDLRQQVGDLRQEVGGLRQEVRSQRK